MSIAETQLQYRRLGGGPGPRSIDVEGRAVEAVLASEAPVPMYDWHRDEMVHEILLMSGARWTEQVPLLDSHARFSAGNVLGSAAGIAVEGDKLVGRVRFSGTAAKVFELVREGHLTDLSVGYRVLERTFVPRGETQSIGGRSFVGPANVVTSWMVREVSVTPIGADSEAKFRTEMSMSQINPQMTNPTAPSGNGASLLTPADRAEIARIAGEAARDAATSVVQHQQQHAEQVRGLCDLAGHPSMADHYLLTHRSLDEIRQDLQQRRAAGQVNLGISLEPGPAQHDKHMGAIRTGFLMRCLGRTSERVMDQLLPQPERVPGHEQYMHVSLLNLARTCLQLEGIDCSRASDSQIAQAALGFVEQSGLQRGLRTLGFDGLGNRGGDPGYHTTGSFPGLMLDSVNMGLRKGYMEYPSTWQTVFRIGDGARDFKDINRVMLGNSPNLEIWEGNKPPNLIELRDEVTSSAVDPYSVMVSFSWKSIVNDSLGALTRVPALLGMAAARTLNRHVWAQVSGNPTMPDGEPLFSTATGDRKKSNHTASGGNPPSVSELQVGTNLMMQQVGLSDSDGIAEVILGVTPRYIVGPSALSTTIKQLVLSVYDPAANAFERYNTGSELIGVIEPLLDASSTTAWYLFANPSMWDTLEVNFLNGYEQPRTRSWQDNQTMAIFYAILHAYSVHVLDFRGAYRNKGAA